MVRKVEELIELEDLLQASGGAKHLPHSNNMALKGVHLFKTAGRGSWLHRTGKLGEQVTNRLTTLWQAYRLERKGSSDHR